MILAWGMGKTLMRNLQNNVDTLINRDNQTTFTQKKRIANKPREEDSRSKVNRYRILNGKNSCNILGLNSTVFSGQATLEIE